MQAVPPASYAYFCFVQPDLTYSQLIPRPIRKNSRRIAGGAAMCIFFLFPPIVNHDEHSGAKSNMCYHFSNKCTLAKKISTFSYK